MIMLRGFGAAVVVAVAGVLAVWAGHIGAAGPWRGLGALVIAGIAFAVLAFVVPLIALDDWEGAGWLMMLPALVLISATVWLTAIDIEVHTGQWKPVVVMEENCQSTDGGCEWRYRVHDAKTEADLGWVTCNEDTLSPGDRTQLHYDPAGHHRPNLEPCAHTSPAWTTALHVVWGVWGLVMLAALAAAFWPEW
ncbi:hypothetical protein [Dactylosporangium sp. NPDC051541]|uniref:hypothetical protein n=1 Tax=Dactylosporangium sp. NPDC051541 TaxID=3363977 RepID=UPI00379D05AF